MPAHRAAADTPCVALFDLDGTLTWRDTLLPYLTGYLGRHPTRWLRMLAVPPALWSYALSHRDRGVLKSRIIRAVMGGDSRLQIDAWSDAFADSLMRRRMFRPAALAVLEAHRAAGDHLVLLSASPDLYVPRIGKLLGFERSICTELRWRDAGSAAARLDGTLATANRRGEEKTACLMRLRADYPGLTVVAYGNSDSDLPHMRRADRAILVNAGARARRAATESGIPVADWT
jgi:phosphatidylglycerophosphatase C